jgi:hypothetical protein
MNIKEKNLRYKNDKSRVQKATKYHFVVTSSDVSSVK